MQTGELYTIVLTLDWPPSQVSDWLRTETYKKTMDEKAGFGLKTHNKIFKNV